VTYRTISYYLDENLAKMIQTPAPPEVGPVSIPVTSTTGVSNANNASGSTSAKTEKPETTLPTKSETSLLSKAATNQPTVSAPASANTSSTTSNAKTTVDSEPPSTASPKPLLKPVSGGVLNGKAVDLPAPLYPEVARRMRASGLVTVEVLIDANGKVIAAKAVSGNNLLQQAAVQAALRARFSPTTLSGQPVRVSGVINYNFAIGK
jgi:periplasmic protein TonB